MFALQLKLIDSYFETYTCSNTINSITNIFIDFIRIYLDLELWISIDLCCGAHWWSTQLRQTIRKNLELILCKNYFFRTAGETNIHCMMNVLFLKSLWVALAFISTNIPHSAFRLVISCNRKKRRVTVRLKILIVFDLRRACSLNRWKSFLASFLSFFLFCSLFFFYLWFQFYRRILKSHWDIISLTD